MYDVAQFYNSNNLPNNNNIPHYLSIPFNMASVHDTSGTLKNVSVDNIITVPYFRVSENKNISPVKVELQIKYVTYLNGSKYNETDWMKVPRGPFVGNY